MPKFKRTTASKAPNKAERVNEIIKCGSDVSYFFKRYVKIPHPIRGLIPFNTFPFQDVCLEKFLEHRFVIVNKSRQLGLSTAAAGYSLWMAIFQAEKNVLVIATKLDTAKNFIKKVETMYTSLPKWLVMPQIKKRTVKELGFSNGSTIKAIPTSVDAGRSEALSLLIVDECVSGETKITVRNKKTGEIREIAIEELYAQRQRTLTRPNETIFMKKDITEWEVLTPEGWSEFSGIKKTTEKRAYEIRTNNCSLKCSDNHRVKLATGNFKEAKRLSIKDVLFPNMPVLEITNLPEKIELFDLLDVKKNNEYYTNNIISHNCAHVEGIDDLWLGLQPTLSTGGSVILISTPAGVGSLFHKIWLGAKAKKNDFWPIELPWTVHPERDEEWFRENKRAIIEAKGERGVAQELLCSFLSSGDTFLKGEVMDRLYKLIKEPLSKEDVGRDEVWIWKHPESGHKYIIGGDVSRGDAEDFSAFSIIDTNTDEVVADFRGKLPPDQFGDLLLQYAIRYNQALICNELNSVGVAAALKLKESGYQNLYYEKFFRNIYMPYFTQEVGDELPGFTTKENNRLDVLAKLENTLRNGAIKTYSSRLYEELQTFIWKKRGMSDKPEAQKGYNDDLVMCLAIGSSLYEAAGRNTMGAEMDIAILQGMGRSTQTLDPNRGGMTRDGFFKVPNSARFKDPRGGLVREKVESLKRRSIHDYNDEAWKPFWWVNED